MSVFHAANRRPLRRPIATFTALTVAGFGFIAAPAFGAAENESAEDTIITTTTETPDQSATSDQTQTPDQPDPSDTSSGDNDATSANGNGEAGSDVAGSDEATPDSHDDAGTDPQSAASEAPELDSGAVGEAELAAQPEAAQRIAPLAVADEVDIDILSINDLHGRIEDDRMSAGGAVLACTVREARADNPNTVFISGGDNIGASTFTSAVDNDQPTLDVLNAIPLDLSTLGNHEFDQGRDDVDGRIQSAANFPYIASNIFTTSGDLAYDAYEIVEKDGVRIGFIGGVTEELHSLVSPAGIETLEVQDLTESINAVAQQLTDGNVDNGEADIVMAVIHDGAPGADMSAADGTPYGKLLTEADDSLVAIISGHTHQAYVAGDEGLWVTQAGKYGENLGKLSLTYDKATGEVTESNAELINLVDQVGDDYVPRCTPSADVQDIIDAAVENAEELGADPIGEITADLNRAVEPEDPEDLEEPVSFQENRGGESTLGNAVADVQLWGAQRTTPGAQIAFMNPGGLRTDLTFKQAAGEGDGVVTYKEASEVQPFANTLVTTDLTGAQIKQVLEEQWQPDGASRPFLKLGVSEGLFYTYDPNADRDERVQQIWLDGELLDLDASYTVVANSFLASGGDNFTTLAQGSTSNDTGVSDLAAMVDYFSDVGELSPDYQQRAVGLTWVSDPAKVYEPGDEVAVDVSSMTFSTTEPKPAELLTMLGGIQTESADVDDSILNTTDEVGRAGVRVTVPEDIGQDLQLEASGEVEFALVITDKVNGTEVSVPVQVAVEVVEEDDSTPPAGEDVTDDPTDEPTAPPVVTPPASGGELAKTGSNAVGLVLLALLFGGVGTGLALKRNQVLRS